MASRHDEENVPARVGRLFLESIRLDRDTAGEARAAALEAVERGIGGFILFGGRREEVRALTSSLREAAGRPLWFAADFERGAGQQVRDAAVVPPPAGLAAAPEPEDAVRRAARITAREARALGVNWVLAPVLDLDVEPENPIVGTRSFGGDPEGVARLGENWIRTCQEEGVAACAKHFPGHGRTTADSHLELPAVEADRDLLEEDLTPFRRVAGLVAGVMTAHVAYPALSGGSLRRAEADAETEEAVAAAAGAAKSDDADADLLPATLEPAILRHLLREELGFRGLVLSDALGMAGFDPSTGAATEGWRAVRALRAGCDLLLYPTEPALTIRTVRQAAENDPDLRRLLAASLERSEAALSRFADAGPARADDGPPDEGAGPEPPGEAAPEETRSAAMRLARSCVVERGMPPSEALSWEAPVRVVSVSDDETPGQEPRDPLAEAFRRELEAAGWRVGGTPSHVVVLLSATPRAWKGRASLAEPTLESVRRALGRSPRRGYLLVFGHLRILDHLHGLLDVPGACAWSSEPDLGRAAARWLDARVRAGVEDGETGPAGKGPGGDAASP